jgi:hypothetical protein
VGERRKEDQAGQPEKHVKHAHGGLSKVLVELEQVPVWGEPHRRDHKYRSENHGRNGASALNKDQRGEAGPDLMVSPGDRRPEMTRSRWLMTGSSDLQGHWCLRPALSLEEIRAPAEGERAARRLLLLHLLLLHLLLLHLLLLRLLLLRLLLLRLPTRLDQ